MTHKNELCQEDVLIDGRNRRIPVCSWLPSKTKYQLLIVHGFSEHMRCYYPVAKQLSERGTAVHLMDLPGHGLAEGFRGHIDDFREYLDHVDLFFDAHPGFMKTKPVFLLGHSLGGLIAVHYCLRPNVPVKGVILSSPLIGLASPFSFLTTAWAMCLARRDPKQLIAKGGSVAALSRDPEKWQFYASDPYRLHTISPNHYLAMNQYMKLLHRRASRFCHPLLVFYTQKDRVVSPPAIERFFQQVSSGDKTLIAFTRAMHELFQEKEHRTMLNKMIDWMDKRI